MRGWAAARSPAQPKTQRADSAGPRDAAPRATESAMIPRGTSNERPACPEEVRPCRTRWTPRTSYEAHRRLSGKSGRLGTPTSRDHEVCGLEPRSPPDTRARPRRGWGPGQSVPDRPSGQTTHGRQKMPLSREEERVLPEPGHAAGTSNVPSPLARPPEPPSRVATTPENLQRP